MTKTTLKTGYANRRGEPLGIPTVVTGLVKDQLSGHTRVVFTFESPALRNQPDGWYFEAPPGATVESVTIYGSEALSEFVRDVTTNRYSRFYADVTGIVGATSNVVVTAVVSSVVDTSDAEKWLSMGLIYQSLGWGASDQANAVLDFYRQSAIEACQARLNVNLLSTEDSYAKTISPDDAGDWFVIQNLLLQLLYGLVSGEWGFHRPGSVAAVLAARAEVAVSKRLA